jgi:hypothetical protein
MTATLRPRPADGPWHTREQAEIRYAGFCRAAKDGTSGPPGEQLLHPPGHLELCTMTDTLETLGVDLGRFDVEVLGRLAAALDPLAVAVVNSLFQRAAGDDYDQAVYVAAPRPRHLAPVP